MLRVEEVMSTRVWTCRAEASLAEPAGLMWRHAVGIVPVVAHDGRLVGVVTDRDIAMAALLQGRALDAVPVRGVMATDVATCGPGDAVALAAEAMRARRVRRLPVVDAGRVVGLLSLDDLAARVEDGHRGGPTASELARTLRAICACPGGERSPP